MLTHEENERLTRVGPGTPMGDLLRRYWHPIAIRAELQHEPVQPLRLLGENLTLFLSGRGEIGLIGERCAHRAISLAYGIPQENGLRCAYHGWTYDTEGRVVDMPFEPACLPLRISSYPVEELGGLIWAYLGPEPRPLLPRWEMLVRDDLARTVSFKSLACNWLQCMENAMDPVHFEHLHGHYWSYFNRKYGVGQPAIAARHLKIDFDVFEYGVYKRRLLEGAPPDSDDWTVGHPMTFPTMLVVPAGLTPGYQIRVPVDDTHTMHVIYSARPAPHGEQNPPLRVERRVATYDARGLFRTPTALEQDEMAWIEQGAISNRTAEHLATSDAGVGLYRKLLVENIARVERGEDPMGVIRDPEANWPFIALRGERSTAKMIQSGATALPQQSI